MVTAVAKEEGKERKNQENERGKTEECKDWEMTEKMELPRKAKKEIAYRPHGQSYLQAQVDMKKTTGLMRLVCT